MSLTVKSAALTPVTGSLNVSVQLTLLALVSKAPGLRKDRLLGSGLAGVAGICYAAQIGQMSHTVGSGYELQAIAAAVLGRLADVTSIVFVYHICAYLPAIGLLTAFLPNLERPKPAD